MGILALLSLSVLALVGQAGQAGKDTSGLGQMFAYDSSSPLQIEKVGSQQQNRATIEDITYAGANNERVPAYLVVPPGNGPFAAILWGHWMKDGSPVKNRSEFLPEAEVLAKSGVVSLLIDAPMVRTGHKKQDEAADTKQDVVDLRRGLDLLLARKDVDSKRVGYVGHSFHAGTGGILVGVEPRIKTFVLMAGDMDANRFLTSEAKVAVEVRKKYPIEDLKKYLAANDSINPLHYVQGKHGPILLQYGTHDEYMTKADCEEYASVVSPPKETKFYDAGHELNAAARRDRSEWLKMQLGFKEVDWKAMEKVPEIQ